MPTGRFRFFTVPQYRHVTVVTGTDRRPHGLTNLLLISCVLSLGTTACRGSAGPHDVIRERLPSGGERVTWHTLDARPLMVDTVAVWHLWRSPQEYEFGNVRAVAGAADGFYLLDGVNQQVVQISRQGLPVRVLGRRGAGPGEFQAALRLFVRGDEIWVADIALGRYTVFAAGGALLRTIPWTGPGRTNSDGFAITAAGTEMFSSWSVRGLWVLRSGSLDGASVDTLAAMNTLPRAEAVINLRGDGPTTMYDPPAYSPGLRWTLGGQDRVFTVTTAQYQVEERDLTGQVRRELVGPTPDLKVTDIDRRIWVRLFAQLYGVDEALLRERNPGLEDRYPFAERRAAIESVRVDPVGRLWVAANTVTGDRVRLDLFDADLAFVGSVTGLPQPEAFTGDGDALVRVAGGDEDGTDLFLVVRVRAPARTAR